MKFWKILIALIFTIVLLVFARKTTTVKSVHKTVDRGGILIEHDTVPKRRGAGDVVIPVKVSGAEEVKLFYRIGKMEFRAVDMNLKEGERNLFVASIPHHKKGTRAWYYIEAQKQNKDEKIAVSLPDKNSLNFKPILLKFQGNVPPYIILSHIFCLSAAIFFSVLAAFSAVDLKKAKGTMNKSVAFSLVTFIFLFMGFFPLGWALNYYTSACCGRRFPSVPT